MQEIWNRHGKVCYMTRFVIWIFGIVVRLINYVVLYIVKFYKF